MRAYKPEFLSLFNLTNYISMTYVKKQHKKRYIPSIPKKTLTEQVEEYFRYRQAHVYHKCKLRGNKDDLWRPPKREKKETVSF